MVHKYMCVLYVVAYLYIWFMCCVNTFDLGGLENRSSFALSGLERPGGVRMPSSSDNKHNDNSMLKRTTNIRNNNKHEHI